MFITGYKPCTNIGDLFQTIAVLQWVDIVDGFFFREQCKDVYGPQYLVNGWWCDDRFPYPPGATCIGLHSNVPTMSKSAPSVLGARDHYTYYCAKALQFQVKLTGCWVSTFPRYQGERFGELNIDGHNTSCKQITQACEQPEELESHKMRRAFHTLQQLRRASFVWTQRLHVALACKAFGTPYRLIPAANTEWRYSALDIEEDIVAFASKYVPIRREPRGLWDIFNLMKHYHYIDED